MHIMLGRWYYTEIYLQLSITSYQCSYLEDGDAELPLPQPTYCKQMSEWFQYVFDYGDAPWTTQ